MPPTPPFPLYLLPSIPFRRRRSSATTTSTISPSSSPSSSPPQPTSFLSTRPVSHLQCSKCLSHLLPTSSIISKGFTGRYGRAYLCGPVPQTPTSLASTFGDACPPGDLPNTLTGKPMPRQLVTGAHTVSDITCKICGSVLGWKYVEAKEETQKYKVGKYILETKRVVRSSGWDGDQDMEAEIREHDEVVDDIEFDSQDEDECEDLFMGVWSKELAVRRRRNKTFST